MCTFASMKRIIPLILVCFLLTSPTLRAETIDSIFAKSPINDFSLLTLNNRLDLLDYANCGQRAVVENLCEGKTELLIKRDNYLKLAMTSVNTVELLLLKREIGDTIVCIVSTIHTPTEESQLKFFTLGGARLVPPFALPKVEVMLDSLPDARQKSPWNRLLTVKATVLEELQTLVCEVSTKLLPVEEKKKLSALYGTRRYTWNGTTFVLQGE